LSIVHLLAYDLPLPETDMRVFREKIIGKTSIGFVQGFSVSNCYWLQDNFSKSIKVPYNSVRIYNLRKTELYLLWLHFNRIIIEQNVLRKGR